MGGDRDIVERLESLAASPLTGSASVGLIREAAATIQTLRADVIAAAACRAAVADHKLWGVWDNDVGHWYGEMASQPRAAFAYDMDIDELKARWGKMGPEYIIAPFPRTQREWKEGPTAAIELAKEAGTGSDAPGAGS